MDVRYEYMSRINLDMVKDRLPCRYEDSHKGTFGTMLCISGSKGMVGAGMFPILAALRSGVGLVRAMMIESLYNIVSKDILEPVYIPLEENSEGTISEKEIPRIVENLNKCSSVLIGCGIGWNKDSEKIVEEEIVELVRSYYVFSDLADLPVLCRKKLRGDRSCKDVCKDFRFRPVFIHHVRHQVAYKRLRNR